MAPRPTAAELKLIDPDGSFRQRLIDDRARLATLAAAGDAPGLQRLAHGLAGAAGTFGYAEVGDRAIGLEDLLMACRQDAAAMGDAAVATALAALRAALGDALAD